ncbi:MAG: hypothetical protein WCQ59_09695 [Candidatus Cloacimonadaceae bacterium]
MGKRLIAFPSEASPQLADSAYIHSNAAGQERRTTFTAIKTLLFGGKTVGGTGAGDIADIDSAQTFANKRLTAPGINSATAVTADSAEINILDGASITTTELNRLSGVTHNIQTQINNITAGIESVTTKTFTYGTGIVTGSGTQIISEATLRTPTGAGNGYRVDPDSIIVCVWQLNAGAWNQLAPDDQNAAVGFTTAVVSFTTVLNQISVKLDSAKDSKVIVTYKLMELSGV